MSRELPSVTMDSLLDTFFSIGPFNFTGTASTPISLGETQAYSNNIRKLNSWEFDTLRYLSKVYLNQRALAKEPNCPPPWDVSEEIDRNKIAEGTKAMFRNMRKKSKEPKGIGAK